jgi:hypothetical protein
MIYSDWGLFKNNGRDGFCLMGSNQLEAIAEK